MTAGDLAKLLIAAREAVRTGNTAVLAALLAEIEGQLPGAGGAP